jgi:prepilin-type N-terminal cleavage/methylation domain-containing protein
MKKPGEFIPKSEQGFTLIEVLVALVVTSFLVAIILDGSVSAKMRQSNQALQADALFLAKSNIDNLRDRTGEPASIKGKSNKLQWVLQETEVARGPRGAFILVEATIKAGSEDKPELITLKKRYLKSLIAQ